MTDTRPKEAPGSHIYRSTTGIDYDSVPFRLWDKSKKLFWDPADIDFTQDVRDWAEMTEEQRLMVAGQARGFMVGEEAVTIDILPLLRAMSEQGRLEDTMYLTMFAMEEAKHIDFFRRWFDAVGFDASVGLQQQQGNGDGYGGGGGGNGYAADGQMDPFESLNRIMKRLDNDPSPKRILDATLLYNHLIEAVFAIAGYRRWEAAFATLEGKLQGFQTGLRNIQRDERRHIAYGTYLARRIISENPDLWPWVEQRWAKMCGPLLTGEMGDEISADLAKRRLEVLAVARGQSSDDVEHNTDIDDFEPEGMPADVTV